MRRYAALLALASSGCFAAQPVSEPIPDDVEWLATLTVDLGGASRGSTLVRANQDPYSVAHYGESEVYVLGFTARDLEPLTLKYPEVSGLLDSGGSIRVTEGCERGLPAPSWVRRVDASGQLETIDSETAPEVTLEGLEGFCDDPFMPSDPSSYVVAPYSLEQDPECFVCGADPVTRTKDSCRFELDLDTCAFMGQGKTWFRVHWDGALCFEDGPCRPSLEEQTSSDFFYCRTESRSTCEEQPIHLVTADDHVPPVGDMKKVRLTTDWHTEQALLELTDQAQYQSYVTSMLELGSMMMLTVHPTKEAGTRCFWPPLFASPGDTELWFIDEESMEVVRTATAPPCLTRTMNDPIGDGFLGVFETSRSDLRIGRFDRSGRMLDQLPLGLPEADESDPWAAGLYQLSADGDILVVVGGQHHGGAPTPNDNFVVLVRPDFSSSPDVRPLTFLAASGDKGVRIESATPLQTESGPGLALVEGLKDAVYGIDEDVSETFVVAGALASLGGSYRPSGAISPGPGRLMVTTAISTREVLEFVVDSGQVELQRRARAYERDSEAMLLQPWNDHTVLVFSRVYSPDGTTHRSFMAEFDTDAWRFIPGARWLSETSDDDPGIPHAQAFDQQGRSWVAFGHTGWLYRFTP